MSSQGSLTDILASLPQGDSQVFGSCNAQLFPLLEAQKNGKVTKTARKQYAAKYGAFLVKGIKLCLAGLGQEGSSGEQVEAWLQCGLPMLHALTIVETELKLKELDCTKLWYNMVLKGCAQKRWELALTLAQDLLQYIAQKSWGGKENSSSGLGPGTLDDPDPAACTVGVMVPHVAAELSGLDIGALVVGTLLNTIAAYGEVRPDQWCRTVGGVLAPSVLQWVAHLCERDPQRTGLKARDNGYKALCRVAAVMDKVARQGDDDIAALTAVDIRCIAVDILCCHPIYGASATLSGVLKVGALYQNSSTQSFSVDNLLQIYTRAASNVCDIFGAEVWCSPEAMAILEHCVFSIVKADSSALSPETMAQSHALIRRSYDAVKPKKKVSEWPIITQLTMDTIRAPLLTAWLYLTRIDDGNVANSKGTGKAKGKGKGKGKGMKTDQLPTFQFAPDIVNNSLEQVDASCASSLHTMLVKLCKTLELLRKQAMSSDMESTDDATGAFVNAHLQLQPTVIELGRTLETSMVDVIQSNKFQELEKLGSGAASAIYNQGAQLFNAKEYAQALPLLQSACHLASQSWTSSSNVDDTAAMAVARKFAVLACCAAHVGEARGAAQAIASAFWFAGQGNCNNGWEGYDLRDAKFQALIQQYLLAFSLLGHEDRSVLYLDSICQEVSSPLDNDYIAYLGLLSIMGMRGPVQSPPSSSSADGVHVAWEQDFLQSLMDSIFPLEGGPVLYAWAALEQARICSLQEGKSSAQSLCDQEGQEGALEKCRAIVGLLEDHRPQSAQGTEGLHEGYYHALAVAYLSLANAQRVSETEPENTNVSLRQAFKAFQEMSDSPNQGFVTDQIDGRSHLQALGDMLLLCGFVTDAICVQKLVLNLETQLEDFDSAALSTNSLLGRMYADLGYTHLADDYVMGDELFDSYCTAIEQGTTEAQGEFLDDRDVLEAYLGTCVFHIEHHNDLDCRPALLALYQLLSEPHDTKSLLSLARCQYALARLYIAEGQTGQALLAATSAMQLHVKLNGKLHIGKGVHGGNGGAGDGVDNGVTRDCGHLLAAVVSIDVNLQSVGCSQWRLLLEYVQSVDLLGSLYQVIGHPREAEYYYRHGLSLVERGQFRRPCVRFMWRLASLHTERSALDKSEAIFDDITRVLSRHGDHHSSDSVARELVWVKLKSSDLKRRQGEWNAAHQLLQEAETAVQTAMKKEGIEDTLHRGLVTMVTPEKPKPAGRGRRTRKAKAPVSPVGESLKLLNNDLCVPLSTLYCRIRVHKAVLRYSSPDPQEEDLQEAQALLSEALANPFLPAVDRCYTLYHMSSLLISNVSVVSTCDAKWNDQGIDIEDLSSALEDVEITQVSSKRGTRSTRGSSKGSKKQDLQKEEPLSTPTSIDGSIAQAIGHLQDAHDLCSDLWVPSLTRQIVGLLAYLMGPSDSMSCAAMIHSAFAISFRRQMQTLLHRSTDDDSDAIRPLYEDLSMRQVIEDYLACDDSAPASAVLVLPRLLGTSRVLVCQLHPSQARESNIDLTMVPVDLSPLSQQFQDLLVRSAHTTDGTFDAGSAQGKKAWWEAREALDKDMLSLVQAMQAALPISFFGLKESTSQGKGKKPSNETGAVAQPGMLILDKSIQALPWESIPVLRPHAITRVPCLHFVRSHQLQPPVAVTWQDTQYVLNPSRDLKGTQGRFEALFTGQATWKGIIDQRPTPEFYSQALRDASFFIYMGHGAGEEFLTGDAIQRLQSCAPSLLVGCSSGRLADEGDFEPSGMALCYLLGGSPLVVANLWDVTDKDIDRFGEHVIKEWLLQDATSLSLPQAVSQARNETKLQYLIGAAPVCYGVPVLKQQSTGRATTVKKKRTSKKRT